MCRLLFVVCNARFTFSLKILDAIYTTAFLPGLDVPFQISNTHHGTSNDNRNRRTSAYLSKPFYNNDAGVNDLLFMLIYYLCG